MPLHLAEIGRVWGVGSWLFDVDCLSMLANYDVFTYSILKQNYLVTAYLPGPVQIVQKHRQAMNLQR